MSDRILHQSLEETKTVSKPWGQEKWIQQGQGDHSYVLKEITLNQGFRTSIQVHQFKAETNYILEGQGELWYSPVFFDCARYLAGGYSADEIQHILDDLRVINYAPGSVMSIEPGTIHRMVAIIDFPDLGGQETMRRLYFLFAKSSNAAPITS